MVKVWRCNICGETYIGDEKPTQCPFCGAHDKYIFEAKEKDVNFDVELSEADRALVEHALEVELPFLQVLFPDLPIAPFICGQVDGNIARDLGNVLKPYLTEDTLWVISSDFTHYGHPFGYVPFSDDIPENLKKG